MSLHYTQRDGHLYRAGLVFAREELPSLAGEWVLYYRPDGPFFVDGIEYNPRRAGVHSTHPICALVDPRGKGWTVMRVSHPPSDDELDEYVRTGRIPR